MLGDTGCSEKAAGERRVDSCLVGWRLSCRLSCGARSGGSAVPVKRCLCFAGNGGAGWPAGSPYGGGAGFREEINCVHGFLIGGASFYVDRILWLATYTSSSLSSFLAQLFRVVLMKLNYESENYKLKSYESKDRESESYKSESHESKGI